MSTFYDQFRECAERWPQNPCLEIQRQDKVESYTYAEVRTMAESIGRWLVESGFPRGSRVAILADNHPKWVAVYLGVIAGGCTAVPLDTAFHGDQVAKLLKDSETTLIFHDQKRAKTVQEAIAGLPVKTVVMDGEAVGDSSAGKLEDILKVGPANFVALESPTEEVAALLYTSGTTADPKGVMLTHGNILGEVTAVASVIKLGSDDSILGLLPLFHVLSQMANLLLPLVNGTRVVYLETLNTTELLRALQERNISVFCVVPQFFYLIHERIFKEVAKRGALAQKALRGMMSFNRTLRRVGLNAGSLLFKKVHHVFGPRMRVLVTGGSRFTPEIASDFHALGIDILQAYGLTETSGGAFLNPPGHVVIGSVGKPFATVEGKIHEPQPQESGPPVGEIAIRGPIVMKGYWRRDDATAAVLKDGWLHTGDLGYFDASGNLFITGRQKDVIVLSNGKNVYPEEIEAHYLKSPYIKEIAVIGLEGTPGNPTKDALHAVVVPNFDVLKERKVVNAKEVIRFDIEGLSAELASTKRIGGYEIWQEDLPRTTTRKLKRFEIEKRVRANQAKGVGDGGEIAAQKPLTEEDSAWLEQPDVESAIKVIREASSNPPAEIGPSSNLELDLGFDSMGRVELLVGLEQQLGGKIEESKLADIYTVRDLVDVLLASRGGDAPPRAQFAGWKEVLREDPTDPEVLALLNPQPIAAPIMYGISRIIGLVARTAFHLEVSGVEKLPLTGPFILSSNHQSYIDPAVLASVLSHKLFDGAFAVGTSEIFGSGIMRKLAHWLRVIVLDPDANLVPAMRAGAFGLRSGRILFLYPEGERSIDGTPKTFKKGAAILSIHTQVPIVPVAIEGFHDAWPRNKSFQKFAKLKIRIGDPINPPPESEASDEVYAKMTADLKQRIIEMWEGLRGQPITLPVDESDRTPASRAS
jgi:long-chain acyl-CoA synthetase